MNVYKKCKGSAIFILVVGALLYLSGLFGTPHELYGGDAYSGIQNAAADTANNVLKGCGILVFAIGLVLENYSMIKEYEFKEKEKKHHELLNLLSELTPGTSATIEDGKKSDKPNHPIKEENKKDKVDTIKKVALYDGQWQCECGEVHHKYVTSCYCGKTKREVFAARVSTNQDNKITEEKRSGALTNQEWRCECGEVHLKYEKSCYCGKTQKEVLAKKASKETT